MQNEKRITDKFPLSAASYVIRYDLLIFSAC